jgi:hypothetical protein
MGSDYYFQQRVISLLGQILAEQGKTVAAIDDVTAAISGLSTEITTFLADVASQISGGLTAPGGNGGRTDQWIYRAASGGRSGEYSPA